VEIAAAFEACVGRLFTFTDPRPKNKGKMDELTSAPQQHFGVAYTRFSLSVPGFLFSA
jgi:hypothetical protein